MTHDQMKEMMACQVCSKPPGLPLDKCHAIMGKKNPLCNEYGKCRIAEQSEPQFNYAFSEVDKNIFLKACPGSGKTEVVGLKTAYEIKRWDKEVGGIAVLTFTNNAADVISERVSQFAGIEKIKYPHFIGTFDSWLHGYIAHPFGHFATKYQGKEGDYSIRLIDHKVNSKFLENKKFNAKLYHGKGTIKANKYYRDRKSNEYVYCDNKKGSLDVAFENNLRQAKKNFIEAGFATYQDIENICFKLLSEQVSLAKRIAQRFPIIIIDECQDLSWIQLEILRKIKHADSKLHFVGDLNQSIYGFKKVEPKDIENFISVEGFQEKPLSDNFRSCQPIVDLCQGLVKSSDSVVGTAEQKLEQPCIYLVYEKESDISKLPNWFEIHLKQEKLDIKKSAIITKGWSNVNRMRPSGGDTKINKPFTRLAMAIYLWNTKENQAIGDAIKYMGQFFAEKYFGQHTANARKHYCPECIDSAIKWRIFLKEVLDTCIKNEELIDFDKIGTEWAKCIRNEFGKIAKDCKSLLIEDVIFPDKLVHKTDKKKKEVQIVFNAIKAKDKVTKTISVNSTKKSNIYITTIHSVKGQTFDSIMLVSAPSKSGSDDNHWEHWLGDTNPEAKRLAYVASSRPKHLLVWAVPKGNNGDMTDLTKLGFVPVYLDEDADISANDIKSSDE